MAQGVSGEFGHDEFSKLCLLAEPHAARVLRTSSRACPSSAGSSAIRQVTQDSPVRAGGMQCSLPWSCRLRAPIVSPSGHRLSCTIPGVPTYGSRSSSGSVHRCVDRRLSGCVNAPGNYLLQCRNRT
jgi:hypothetical protein